MIINHNINSIYVTNQLSSIENKIKNNIQKLSSGLRINQAKDDPIGLLVSEKMRSQIRASQAAMKNAQLGISLLQTTESWLNQSNDILQRLRELSVQSANGIYSQEDRKQLETEIKELTSEIDRIANTAEFNKIKLLSNSNTKTSQLATDQNPNPNPEANNQMDANKKSIKIHIGPNMDDSIQMSLQSMTLQNLGLKSAEAADKLSIQLTSEDEANKSIGIIDEAIKKVNEQKAIIGSQQERIEFIQRSLQSHIQNITETESIIRDSNIAEEVTSYMKNKLLKETAVMMLTQSNLDKQSALSLLKAM